MKRLDEPTMARVRELFREFERDLEESNYSLNSKVARANHARRFVDWLAGDYDPRAYDGSYGSR